MPIDVRSARRSDVPALARVLGRAFHDDPVMSWMQPDAARRSAGLPGFFAALARHHFLTGAGADVAVAETGIGAAALWDPPGGWHHSPREQLAMMPAAIRAFVDQYAVG
jgi:hypothetical protein